MGRQTEQIAPDSLLTDNRIELLLFYLQGNQRYGINVFKVREVGPCPAITVLPKRHPAVCGIIDFRGKPIPVIDLEYAVGGARCADPQTCVLIMTEYSMSVQGILVRKVERIVSTTWDKVCPPPLGAASCGSYLTAVTQIQGGIVEILDVEKVLDEVCPVSEQLSETVLADAIFHSLKTPVTVMVVDDSQVARGQVCRTLQALGLSTVVAHNGQEALALLQASADAAVPVAQQFAMVISDIEMPYMDGYSLVRALRADPRLQDLYVVLHSSLSGIFNSSLVTKAGADQFLAKFNPDTLASVVRERLLMLNSDSAAV